MVSQRIFISHAANDKALAGLIERLLLLSGVPRDRIFYSSDRTTGVPAGRSSREVIKEKLRDSPFVVELITETFMTRPMCLMELGAAWVSDVPTFPIVVPPLTFEEVIAQIGDVHLTRLGTEREIDEMFDEFHDRIREHLGVALPLSVWNPAVREFKIDLPAALTSIARPAEASTSTSASDAAAGPSTAERLTTSLVARNAKWREGTFGTEVLGEIANESSHDLQMVLLSATFYDATGGILGTANGSVNGLPGNQSKTFQLMSTEKVAGIVRMRLQTDGQM